MPLHGDFAALALNFNPDGTGTGTAIAGQTRRSSRP
jgi:hypothetical protein